MRSGPKHKHAGGDELRLATTIAQGREEFLKSSKLEFIISLVSYVILGLPVLDIKFIGFIPFSLALNFLTGVITGPIYKKVSLKRYEIGNDETFKEWYGKTWYFPVLALHALIGFLIAFLFKTIWP